MKIAYLTVDSPVDGIILPHFGYTFNWYRFMTIMMSIVKERSEKVI